MDVQRWNGCLGEQWALGTSTRNSSQPWRIPCLEVSSGDTPFNQCSVVKSRKNSESVSCSVMSYSLQPHGLLPTRLLCPWNFQGKNTGMGCHFLLQGVFLTQGSNQSLASPTSAGKFFTTVLPGKPQCSINILSNEEKIIKLQATSTFSRERYYLLRWNSLPRGNSTFIKPTKFWVSCRTENTHLEI